jgi:hypothetical protein
VTAVCALALGAAGGQAAPAWAAPACPQIGTQDKNPFNTQVAPMLGQRLIPPRPDGRAAIGFNDYAPWTAPPLATYDEDMALHRRVGSTVIRIGLQWGHVERLRNVYQWYSADRLYCAAVGAGVKPLFIIWTSPQWATTNCSAPPCRKPPNPAYDGELREFAALAAIRYPQAAFEAWNEPNLSGFWGSAANPTRYTQVLGAVYRGVKDGSPASPVFGGALSNNGVDHNGHLSMKTFLRGMYSAGAKSVMDGVSFHPYPVWLDPAREAASRNFDTVDQILAEQGELGRRHVVASEVGASTAPTTQVVSSQQFTPAQQSEVLWRVYSQAGARANVDAIIFHTLVLRDDPGYGWVKSKDFAGRFYAKPVYCDFAAALGAPFNCAGPIPLG